MGEQKFGTPVQVHLTANRVVCKFGRNVEDVVISNKNTVDVLVELAAYNSSFYVPTGISGGHANRQEIHSPTYFYVMAANMTFIATNMQESVHTGPFRANRGLVIKKAQEGVWATVVLHGIEEGDSELGKA